MKRFLKYIKKCDHFGAQIKLNLHHKETHKSLLGGSVTLLIVAAIILAFIRSSISLINHENYTTQTSQLLNLNPPLTELSVANFMIGFSIDLQQKFNSKLFKFVYQQFNQTIFSDGSISKVPIGEQKEFENCTAKHFNNFDETSSYNELLKNQLNNYKCLPIGFQINQQGTYKSNQFQYGKIMILSCLDELNCLSSKEFMEIGQLDARFKISTLIQNTLINLNEQNSIISYLYSDFYIETTMEQRTSTDIYLEKVNIIQDESTISVIDQAETHDLLQIQDSKLSYSVSEDGPNNLVSQFFLRLAQQESVYKKQYYRFDELISYIGGITKFIVLVFGYFLTKYNKTGLQIMLANDLYQFDLPEEKKGALSFSFQNLKASHKLRKLRANLKLALLKFQPLEDLRKHYRKLLHLRQVQQTGSEHLITNQSISKRNALLTEENLLKSDQLEFMKSNSQNQNSVNSSNLDFYKNNFLEQIINIILVGNKKLKYGILLIIKYLLCWRFTKLGKYKKTIFQQSKAMIQKDMDILVIIQKLMEMEKLKHLLLSKDQLKVFNCLPKPIIGAQRFQSRDTIIMNSGQSFEKSSYSFTFRKTKLFETRHQFNTSKKLRKLYNAYESIKLNQHIANESEQRINQKLIDFLEPTLQHSFNSLAELQRLANISKSKSKIKDDFNQTNKHQKENHYKKIKKQLKQYYFKPSSCQVTSKADYFDDEVVQ